MPPHPGSPEKPVEYGKTERGISFPGSMSFASCSYFSNSDKAPPFLYLLGPQAAVSVGACSSLQPFSPGHCAFVMFLTVVSCLVLLLLLGFQDC